LKLSTNTFWLSTPSVRAMRRRVTSLTYSQVLSSKVALAVGDPISAVTSARVVVPGTSSLSWSASTRLPRSWDFASKKLQPPSARQAASKTERRTAVERCLSTWDILGSALSVRCHTGPMLVNQHTGDEG
jgi:hypothetical protein